MAAGRAAAPPRPKFSGPCAGKNPHCLCSPAAVPNRCAMWCAFSEMLGCGGSASKPASPRDGGRSPSGSTAGARGARSTARRSSAGTRTSRTSRRCRPTRASRGAPPCARAPQPCASRPRSRSSARPPRRARRGGRARRARRARAGSVSARTEQPPAPPPAPERASRGSFDHGGAAAEPSKAWDLRGRHCCFLSHFKAEAATEARLVQIELEKMTGCPCFLDSDDLQDLRMLLDHVRESDVLVLLQTKGLLTRPWCLLEIHTAINAGVPIVAINVKGGHPYDYAASAAFLERLDTQLDAANPGAAQMLTDDAGLDLLDVAWRLSSVLPNIISTDLSVAASRNVIGAQLADVVAAMRAARPLALDGEREAFEKWLERRERKRARPTLGGGEHGKPLEGAQTSAAARVDPDADLDFALGAPVPRFARAAQVRGRLLVRQGRGARGGRGRQAAARQDVERGAVARHRVRVRAPRQRGRVPHAARAAARDDAVRRPALGRRRRRRRPVAHEPGLLPRRDGHRRPRRRLRHVRRRVRARHRVRRHAQEPRERRRVHRRHGRLRPRRRVPRARAEARRQRRRERAGRRARGARRGVPRSA